MEHEELLAKKESGELEPENSYVFYRIFIFLSVITLGLSMCAFGLLTYIAYLFVTGKDVNRGGAPLVNQGRIRSNPTQDTSP